MGVSGPNIYAGIDDGYGKSNLVCICLTPLQFGSAGFVHGRGEKKEEKKKKTKEKKRRRKKTLIQIPRPSAGSFIDGGINGVQLDQLICLRISMQDGPNSNFVKIFFNENYFL